MDLVVNAYLAAFMLGAVHAIEVDHVVAVSVFAGLKPKLKAAASYGARWGLGHAVVVVIVGAVLFWLDIKLPQQIIGWGEVAVGIALIALGLWALRTARKFHTHTPGQHVHSHEAPHGHLHAHTLPVGVASPQLHQHSHQHTHSHGGRRHHQHLPTAMGALHGLAGSAPVLALIPITLLQNFQQALIYLLLFSVGTTLSMTVYAALAALAVQGLNLTKKNVDRLTTGIAVITMSVGCWWIVSTLFLS